MKKVKNMQILQLSLLLPLLLLTVSPATALIEDVLDVLHVVKEVTTGVLKAWDIVQSSPLAANIEFPLMREKQRKVLQRLNEVSRQIDQSEETHSQYVAMAIDSVNSFVGNNIQLSAKMNDISDTMNRISSRYQQMKSYEAFKDQLEMSTLIQFAEWTVTPNAHSVHHLMDRLHLTLLGNVNGIGNEQKQKLNGSLSLSSSGNLLSQLASNYEDKLMSAPTSQNLEERAVLDLTDHVLRNDKTFSMSQIFQEIEYMMVKQALYYRAMLTATDEMCRTMQSPQQFVYSLYTDIALTELKGYIMMEFSWMMLRAYGRGNFSQEAELMRRDYEKRTERAVTLLKEVMRRADRILWRCDPPKHTHNVTYDEVTRLLQGYIENEVDLNSDETCRETCSYYQSTRSEGCFKEYFCARQPKCSGKLYNCQFIDSDMWVCPSAQSSMRRYEYIQYENGRVLGEKQQTCVRGTTKVDSWWRYLFWHCSYCFCLCDEQGLKSDRFFNLRESVSDIKQNSGHWIAFCEKNRIFHLQIQEGQLLPRGTINATTLEWRPVENYKISDRNVARGVDYHTMSYESRSIDLDDIMKTDDNSFVVTGVRFRVLGAHLNLEARLSEFDFKKGELIQPEVNSVWQSNDNTDVSGERRQKLSLHNLDVPTRSIAYSLPQSKHNQYIEFVNTGLDKDAAQTTVPFIDIQDVTSNPPVPLAGIGIYYKARTGYGGFVAPKIITYDFTPHVQVPKTIN